MRRIFTTQEVFGETEPEIIEKGTTMLKEPKAGVEQRMKGIGEIPTFKTPKPLSLENLTLVSLPPDTELDILNEKIEGTYTEYLKLQKKIEEFDTSLSEIPDLMKPTIVANYNNAVNKFNTLIGELQNDIAKRDQIISVQKKQEFVIQKHLAEQEVSQQKTEKQYAGFGESFLARRQKIPFSKSEEGTIKDTMDALILGGNRIIQQSKDYFLNALPNMIFAPLKSNQLYGVNITDEQKEKINIENEKKLELYNKGYNRSQANYYKWIADNPQLQPRKEWEGGVIESVKRNPEVLLDPAYWAYVAADSAAFTIGVLGTTLAITTITQNPLIGMAAGVAVAIPFQTQDLYEDFINSGGTPEQAKYIVPFMGAFIAAVEVMGDLPILASVSKPFEKLLMKNIKSTMVAKIAKHVMKTPVAKFATIEFSETLEEIAQAALQDACVMTVDKNRKFLGDLKEIVAATPMATLPFALFGVSADVNTQNRIKNEIKAKVSKLINDRNLRDAIRIQLEEQGIIPKEPQPVTLGYKTEEEIKEELKTEPKEPTTPEELEAKREMLRKHGVKEELLTDEFVKKAKITELPKADVTTETVSRELIEELEKKWGKEAELTKEKVLEKIEKPPKVEPKLPSDRIRSDYIDKAKESNKIPTKQELFKSDDLVIARKVGTKITYFEQWIDKCWQALYKKPEYKGLNRTDAMEKFVNERFQVIAESKKLKIDDWKYVNGRLTVELSPKEVSKKVIPPIEPKEELKTEPKELGEKFIGKEPPVPPKKTTFEQPEPEGLKPTINRLNLIANDESVLEECTPGEILEEGDKAFEKYWDKVIPKWAYNEGINATTEIDVAEGFGAYVIGLEIGKTETFEPSDIYIQIRNPEKCRIVGIYDIDDNKVLFGNKTIDEIRDESEVFRGTTNIQEFAHLIEKEKVEVPPPKPPVPPKEVTFEQPEPEPEFNKDIKVGDVYTIGEKTPTKKVKGKIREITGQTKKDKILISELDILDLVMKGQEKAARKAFSEGKKEGIFAQKEHFEEVVNRAKERKAQKEYINKLIKDINKLPTQNIAIDYRDKIEAIKDMFDLKKRQQKTLHAREETVKFIEREMEKGDTVLNIPQKTLDIIKTIPLNDMTIAQLETVHDSIIHLAKIGKLKGKMIKVQKGKEIQELARDLVATLYENKVNKISQEKYKLDFNELNRTQKQDIIEDFQKKTRNIKQEIKDISSLKQKVKDPWNHYWINTTLDESLFEKMDGEERGLWHEVFYNTINNCTNTELLNTFEKIEKIRNLFDDNKIDIDKFLEERTGDLMLTHSQRAGLYLCSLDEDALRHVQNAGVIIKKGLEPYQFTDKDIKDVSDSLTKEEEAVVKFYQEYQLTQEKELDEFDVRVRGVHLKGVKNRFAIQVLGEDLYNSVSVELEHNPLTRRAYMEEGFRKERTKRAENVIMLDCITNMLRDIAKVEHYKAYKEAEMDINNLLSNPELKTAILRNPKYGRVAYENITQWFKDSVKAKQNKILSTSDKTLMFLRTSAFISMLGFNVLSGTKQLISLSNAIGLVGLPAVLSGIEQVSLHYNETKQFVFQRDPQARARKGIIDRVMQEWMETTEAKQILKNQTGDIRMKTLFLIRILDEYAVLSVWKGTYDSVINTQKIGGKSIKFTDAADLERQAIEYAAYAIRKTQPSALMKDLPQWFRDGTVAKMFSLFQNQINKNQNFLRDTFRQYGAGKISTGTLAWRTLWNLFLPAILIGTITRGRPPEDWKELARDIATYYIGGWFFVGSIVVNAMQGYGGWMPAPLSFGEEFVKAYTYKTREAQLKHAISGACKVIGLPYNQPYRTIEGVDDWIQGETEDVRRLIWTEYVLGKEEEKPSYEKTKKKKIKKTKKTKKKKKI